MKSRRIRSILKFANNVDVIEDDGDGDGNDGDDGNGNDNVKKRKINKKRNKKTIKVKKTKRSKRQAIGDKGRETRADEEDKDVEKHPDGFVKLQCSPKHQDNDFTCYSNESLFKLKSLWKEIYYKFRNRLRY